MKFKAFRVCLLALLWFGTTFATVALAEEGGGDNRQTPVQVIVQIAVTAIALGVLGYFDLP